MRHHLNRQRGAITIMVALTMLLLLALVGLVVDAGMVYMVKARLNAAVDSAALAAARAVTIGDNRAEQRASAQAAAARFFEANIPQGYMLSKPQLLGTDVTFDVAGTVTIDVRAEAPMPVSLMQVMGFTAMAPGASAQTIRRDLDMAFVVDTSSSLRTVASSVRAAAKSFLNKFNVTQDRVALINFSTGAQVDSPIYRSARGFDRPAMLNKIAAYQFPAYTSSVEGMWNAREQLNAIAPADRSVLRVIVFFSDGVPNGFGARFPFADRGCDKTGVVVYANGTLSGLYDQNQSDDIPLDGCAVLSRGNSRVSNLPIWYNAHNPDDVQAKREFPIVTSSPRVVTTELTPQNVTRVARNLPEAIAAKARDEGIVVFTLGLGPDLRVVSDGEKGEDILKCMANVADGPSRCYNPAKPVGMYCYAGTEADLTPCFSRLASAILRIAK